MNIVFGGSFDPITRAHQDIIEFIIKKYQPEYFIIVIAGVTYYKQYVTSWNDRLNMIKLACSRIRGTHLIYSDIEKDQYLGTLNTLNILSKEYPNLTFLLGADQFIKLKTWIDYESLIKNYSFIVLDRQHLLTAQIKKDITKQNEGNFSFLAYNNKGAASDFRKTRKAKLVDPQVWSYIKEHQLY
ncbi:MAG: nicotinate-nicotinamide nucleotide adenylyltransferase [Acholeplasmatales bacterium]|jgi:nicotinate-nucleotide adenylyltransferase|nr:nicotinate-nicotinamide nucleotide adenylyltransferase [Acholeplasmatales bacterium]